MVVGTIGHISRTGTTLMAAVATLMTMPARVVDSIKEETYKSYRTSHESLDYSPACAKRIFHDNFSLREMFNLLMLLQCYYGQEFISFTRSLSMQLAKPADTAGFEILCRPPRDE